MASPFPFTAGQVLTAAQLNSIGEATAFTPSWTGLTPGDATESWYYWQINDFVFVEGITIFGSTTSITGTNPSVAAPVGSITSFKQISGHAVFFDSGGVGYRFAVVDGNGASIRPRTSTVTGSELTFGNVTSSAPFTWGTGDSISVSCTYGLR